LIRCADRQTGVFEQPVPAINQHRDRCAGASQLGANLPCQSRRDQPRPVVGEQHRIRPPDSLEHRALECLPALDVHGAPHGAIDAHYLLFGRVDAAGENPRLDGRRRAVHPYEVRGIHSPVKRIQHTSTRVVATDHRHERRSTAERGNVVGRITSAARHDLGRVVLED
jgi:hypothetical protein